MDAVEIPADATGTSHDYTRKQLVSALRNREMPLEALRYSVTPGGLHYLMSHYDLPEVDPGTWRLTISGAVREPRSFDLSGILELPRLDRTVTMECAGNGRGLLRPRPDGQPWLGGGVSTAVWSGPPLWPILEQAGLADDALEVAFVGADRGLEAAGETAFVRSLSPTVCRDEGVLLAVSMNGHLLPVQHGAPVRLVVPGWYGVASVKWLVGIEVLRHPFEGLYQTDQYRIVLPDDTPPVPVSRMLPRAMLVPPGLPDRQSAGRWLPPAPVVLQGRAWSGLGAVVGVDVSVDGGRSWGSAELGPPVDAQAWIAWEWSWTPEPGAYEVRVRATDDSGASQPLEPSWNAYGYSNNAAHTVPVTVGHPAPDRS